MKDVLFAYSEWLDGQGLVVSDQGSDADKRSHDELVSDFLTENVERLSAAG